MKKKKRKLLLPIVLVLLTGSGILLASEIKELVQPQPENNINTYLQDTGDIQVYFCPRENCEQALVDFLDSANYSIHCALFEIDLPAVQQKLLEKRSQIEVQIVTDNDYLKEFNHTFVKADSWGLMHNKFCIIDGKKVSSGSMNPTVNCAHKNNNNLLLINSPLLAQNYEDEFQEMWNGTFKKGSPVKNPSLMIGEIPVKNYFCPEDHCADQVKEELEKAKQSIYFMTFSFTHEGIANIILLQNRDNLTIRGVMETKQISEYSPYEKFRYQGINVLKDGNKYNLHHKVFIIDNETVITGSFNPTGAGDERNDENLLIIKDKNITKQFLDEFEKVWDEAVLAEEKRTENTNNTN